jgi:hypothetical protein
MLTEDDDMNMENDPFLLDDEQNRAGNANGNNRTRDVATPDFHATLPIILDRNMTAMDGIEQIRRDNAATQALVQADASNQATPESNLANSVINRKCIRQATLVLRTRRHNEPLIRVRRGSIVVRNIVLKHICHGLGKFHPSSPS